MRRRLDPFDRRAMLGSLALHVVLFVAAWVASQERGPEIEFIAYEIDLVSPPPAAQAEEPEPAAEELVVETPEPEPLPLEPEPEEEPVPLEEPEPEPEPEPAPEPPPEPVEEEEVEPSTVDPPPEEPPEESGEGINVRMEGLRRDYPEYYNNIIRQIQRCFRPPGGSWRTVVSFLIQRDGTVSDIDFVQRSGNPAFDFQAMGAVECAGQGRFGPLPEDLPWQVMPILFEFRPIGNPGDPTPAAPDQAALPIGEP